MLAKSVGAIVTVVGVLFVAAGAATWLLVQTQLSHEHLTVASDAPFLRGSAVAGPVSAVAEAQALRQHELDATGGKTYGELDPADPLRLTALAASYQRASLLTSVVAFGVAGLAMVMGVVLFLLGLVVRRIPGR